MISAFTQRIAALGTRCRRSVALLMPLASSLLLFSFHALLFIGSLRGRWDRHFSAVNVSERRAARELAESSADTGRRAGGLRLRLRGVVATTAAVFGGTLIAASMAGGTYALLNAQQTTPAVTVSSGSLAVTVQASGTTAGATTAIPTAAWTGMLPGDFVGQAITVNNTGTIGTILSARLSALTAWDIRMAFGACPATQLTSTPLTTTAVSYGTVAAGSTTTVCIQATLPTSAAASVENTSPPFTLNLDAKQVTP